MSVQAGIWNFDGTPIDPKLLNEFNESLKQQSPDGESSYVEGNVAMLYRPFHTTAESRREKQPHITRRGFILTWDGRVDNRDELIARVRSELEAHPTDIAIIGAAFDRWETECFQHIIGDWAVSIWKPQERELVLAIDYMAVRHIFYYLKKDRIWWSTDPSPLILLSGDRFHIDDDYIAGYLAHDPDAHLTPYREIREVSPGQFVNIRDGSASIKRYWRFSPRSRIRYKTDAEYEDHFRHVFRQSVRRRLRSDSPILAELSGGLDSSSIVCMADNILDNEGAQASCLDTLSFYDKTEPRGDDWVYFPKVEEKRGKIGHHIDTSKLGSSPASLEYAEFQPLPGFLGERRQIEAERGFVVRRSGYRAVLCGVGGDEFLGGLSDPRAQLADLIVQFRPISLARQLTAWSLAKRQPWIHLLGQASADLLFPSLGKYLVNEARVEPWIEKDFAKRTRMDVRLLGSYTHFRMCLPTRRSLIAGVLSMGDKLAKHIPARAEPEEARYPYLDQSLIEFILSIPAVQLHRPGERRSLMRRSLAGVVPHDVLWRRTKGISLRTPLVALQQNWEELRTAFSSPLTSKLGYLNRTHFMSTLDAAKSGKAVHIVRLLRAVSLEFWLRDLATRGLVDAEVLSSQSSTPDSLQISNSSSQLNEKFHHSG